MLSFKCAMCGDITEKATGAVNRAIRIGSPLYCGRKCFGLARRKEKTILERKLGKRLYDIEYRRKNRDLLKVKKSKYHKRVYDPVVAAKKRKKTMPRHIEYCRRNEYREWKKKYDRKYLAKKNYGDFADAALILRDIECEIDSRMNRYEVYQANGTLNKHQQRRRDYERLNSN